MTVHGRALRCAPLGALLVCLILAACTPAAPSPPQPAQAQAQPPADQARPAAPVPSAPAAAPTAPPEAATVRVGGLGGLGDRAFYVGQAKGFFQQQGLTLETEVFPNAAQMLPVLSTGRLDVGTGGISAGFFNAVLTGVPLRIVSDVTVIRPPQEGARNPYWIVLRKDLADTVRGVRDLRDMRVAMNGTTPNRGVAAALAYHDMALTDVDIQSVSFPEQLAALANGAVDAAFEVEPFITLGQERGVLVPLFDMGYAIPNDAGQQLFYAADFAQQQPDVARRFMVAHVQGLRYIEDALFKGINRDEVIQIYVKNTTITDPALYDRMLHVYNEVDGKVNVEALDRDQDFNVRQGQQREKIDLRALVDPTYSDYAVQLLGRYQR